MTARRLVGVAATGVALAMTGGVARGDEALRVAVVGEGTDGDAIASVIASRLASPATAPTAAAPTAAGPTAAAPAPVAPSAEASSTKPPDTVTGGPTSVAPRARDRTRAGAKAILGAALQGGSRHFAYVDRLTPTLRPYDLFVAPLVAVSGEIYPFTTAPTPVLNGLGATASYARAFGLASEQDGGTRVSTSWQTFALALRERLAVGSAFILGIDAGYGDTSFAFDNPIQPTAQLPSVHYKVLRGGLDGRYARGDLSVRAGAGYLGVLSTGDFAALFPRASLGGIDASLGVADQIGPALELSFDLAYTRFFYDLSPQPGDAYVAGGALDEMATVSLGIAYLF